MRRDFCGSASNGSGGASPRNPARPHIRISLLARLRSTAAKPSKRMNPTESARETVARVRQRAAAAPARLATVSRRVPEPSI